MKWLGWLAALCVVCLPAIWPLGGSPFFASDDGLFHLYRLAALDDALRQGELYPRLFPSFAYGYGQAVLAYYGPLGYYLAEIPRWLGATLPDALKWTFAFGYVASAVSAFALARRYVSSWPALLGAVVYVYFPYHLAETYQRGALAEQLAFVFLPLALLALTPLPTVRALATRAADSLTGDNARLLLFVFSLAGLILTHSLTALIFAPFACLYYLLMQSGTPWQSRFVTLAIGLLATLGLSAFYWLPIMSESRWVGLSAGLDNEGYRAHLAPLWGFIQPSLIFQYAPRQLVAADQPLGLLALVLLLAILAGTAVTWRRRSSLARPLSLFALLSGAALFMTVDLSDGPWRLLHNPLTFLQYPWRFMTLAALGIAMGAALVFGRQPRVALALLPLVMLHALLGLPSVPLQAAPADEQAMWQNDFAQRQIGATWTAEYMPLWVRADRTAIPAPSRSPVSDVAAPVQKLILLDSGYTVQRYHLRMLPQSSSVPGGGLLRFHQFFLPQWRATLDGTPLKMEPSTDLGLLTLVLPETIAGSSANLVVSFGLSDVEVLGVVLSLVTLAAIAWFWRGWWVVPAGLLLLLALLYGMLARPVPQTYLVASKADIQIAGFAGLLAARIEQRVYHPGDTLNVRLTWQGISETRENYKGFAHLMDLGDANVIAQSDGDPVGGFTPTSQWRNGEVIEETRTLRIPPETAPGPHRLYTGLYRLQPLQNLPATRSGEPVPGGRILLGEIQVVAN
jgi:hypothetical protein